MRNTVRLKDCSFWVGIVSQEKLFNAKNGAAWFFNLDIYVRNQNQCYVVRI